MSFSSGEIPVRNKQFTRWSFKMTLATLLMAERTAATCTSTSVQSPWSSTMALMLRTWPSMRDKRLTIAFAFLCWCTCSCAWAVFSEFLWVAPKKYVWHIRVFLYFSWQILVYSKIICFDKLNGIKYISQSINRRQWKREIMKCSNASLPSPVTEPTPQIFQDILERMLKFPSLWQRTFSDISTYV